MCREFIDTAGCEFLFGRHENNFQWIKIYEDTSD